MYWSDCTSPCQLQVWKLSEIQTVPEAFEAFSQISAVPSDLRRWHGSRQDARPSSTAFSRFKNGLAAEVRTRMAALGSTMAAVVGALKLNLEMERQRLPATRTVSSLQQLCSRYSSDAIATSWSRPVSSTPCRRVLHGFLQALTKFSLALQSIMETGSSM